MKTRRLGRTGIQVGEIGLGTEYLNGQPRETVCSVIREAADRGVSYIDVLFAFQKYRQNIGAAIKGIRQNLTITGHIGCAETAGQYRRTRDIAECRYLFEDLLVKLDTDYVDVLMVQFVDEDADYEQIMGPGGLLELAQEYRRQGKARFIGMSVHGTAIAQRAVESGEFDVLMYPRNVALAPIPEISLMDAVKRNDVGLVAMKPFGGGSLMNDGGPVKITPVHCLSYVLDNSSISCVVPGVKNVKELSETLRFVDASNQEKDYREILNKFVEITKGSCTYCNHCQPCPSGINIGAMMSLLDNGMCELNDELRNQYKSFAANASVCIECGVCQERCPFGVDVVSRMKKAAELYK